MKKKFLIIYIIWFLIFIITPNLLMLTDAEDAYKKYENRNLKTEVKLSFDKLKERYQNNFGGRFLLFEFYKKVSDYFKESPFPRKVMFGKNDFLFIGDEFSNAFSESLGKVNFDANELEELTKVIGDLDKTCSDQNIELYISIAPGKHSVFPQYLPFRSPKIDATKLEQLKQLKLPLEVIDLKEDLVSNIDYFDYLPYRKQDTHWNEIGGFWGYKSLMKSIKQDFPNLKSLSVDDIYKLDTINLRGDLDNMMGIDRRELVPEVCLDEINSSLVNDEIKIPWYYHFKKDLFELRYKNKKPINHLKILMFRDSYTYCMTKYISESFSESVLLYSHQFDKDIVLNEKPDIIIYELGERIIERLLTITALDTSSPPSL